MKKIIYISRSSLRFDSRVKYIADSLVKEGYEVLILAEKMYKNLSIIDKSRYTIFRLNTLSGLYAIENNTTSIHNPSESQIKKIQRSFISAIKNLKVRIYITVFLNRLIWNFNCFFKLIKEKPNLIIARDPNTLLVAYIASKFLKIPIIYDSHEIWNASYLYLKSTKIMQKYWDIVERQIIKKVFCTFITTESKRDILKNKYKIESIYVVKNTSPYQEIHKSNQLREEFNIQDNIKILIYQGQMSQIRGIFDIVDAIEFIDGIALIFMGMGDDVDNMVKYVQSKNLSFKVFFKSVVKPEEVIQSISSADIGIQPFHYTENIYSEISIKLLECIMAGLACIGVDFPEIKRIIENNNLGFTFQSGNVKMLEEQILKLINNPELLEKCKKNSLHVRHQYSWEVDEKVLLQKVKECL